MLVVTPQRRREGGDRRARRCSRASRSSAAASTRPAPASRRSSARAPTASSCRCRASARRRSCWRSSAQTARLSLPSGGQPHRRPRCRGRALDEVVASRRWTSRASSTCSSGARWSPASSWSTASPPSTRTAGRRSTSASTRRAARPSAPTRRENIGKPFAIVLDDEVISAPVIQSHIPGGSGIITGSFTAGGIRRGSAILLRAGALPAEITVLEQRTVGPELGAGLDRRRRASRRSSPSSAVVAFMVASYGLFGVMADRRHGDEHRAALSR